VVQFPSYLNTTLKSNEIFWNLELSLILTGFLQKKLKKFKVEITPLMSFKHLKVIKFSKPERKIHGKKTS
jgi:hypothetical protein